MEVWRYFFCEIGVTLVKLFLEVGLYCRLWGIYCFEIVLGIWCSVGGKTSVWEVISTSAVFVRVPGGIK